MTMGQEPTVWARPALRPAPINAGPPMRSAGPGWGAPAGWPHSGWVPPSPAPTAAPGLQRQGAYPGPAPYGQPAGWPPAAPARGSAGPWWVLGAFILLAVVVVAVTLVLATSGGGSTNHSARTTAPTATPPPKTQVPLPVTALAGLLPGPGELAAEAGTGPTAQYHTTDRLFVDHIVDGDCLGAVSTGSDEVYQGSGWLASRAESLIPVSDNPANARGTWLAAVSYPDASGASAMYAKLVAVANRCAGRSVNTRDVTNPADHDYFTVVGRPDEHDGILVLSRTDEGGEGWGCQNATTARNNVVITAGVCGNYIDAGVVESIVQNVAAKVTTQT
jgi:hypothetical protein